MRTIRVSSQGLLSPASQTQFQTWPREVGVEKERIPLAFTPPAPVLFLVLVIAACGRATRDAVPDTASARVADTQPQSPASSVYQPDPDTAGDRLARLGVIFDPGRVRIGDTIAGLVMERIVAHHTPMDSTLVGTAAFRGTIELAGATMRHPEADATKDVCFEADSASAARLPRWAGDRRRAWFCFSNAAAAARALGPPRTEWPARVVISHFVIHRGLTDEVNAAQFVRLAGLDANRNGDRAMRLEQAAEEIVGFLRGNVGFEKIHLADTVVLYLSPEGGGTRTRFTRAQLSVPSSWVLRSGRSTYSFVPPQRLTTLTAKAGRHFNCLEYPLASRFRELAALPHVGVKLEPDGPTSCLETWNATFIFNDSGAQPPRLVAAVYDQWEW